MCLGPRRAPGDPTRHFSHGFFNPTASQIRTSLHDKVLWKTPRPGRRKRALSEPDGVQILWSGTPPTADGDKVPGRGVVSLCLFNRLPSIPPHGALLVITWRDTGCARGVLLRLAVCPHLPGSGRHIRRHAGHQLMPDSYKRSKDLEVSSSDLWRRRGNTSSLVPNELTSVRTPECYDAETAASLSPQLPDPVTLHWAGTHFKEKDERHRVLGGRRTRDTGYWGGEGRETPGALPPSPLSVAAAEQRRPAEQMTAVSGRESGALNKRQRVRCAALSQLKPHYVGPRRRRPRGG
ncbi:unnamed protein product [Arctogadus glacialis]